MLLPAVIFRCFDSRCPEREQCWRWTERFSSQARAATHYNPGPDGHCCPDNPAPTWTEAFKLECLARWAAPGRVA